MKYENIGAHCSLAECHRKDFLPFKCEKCGQIFCLEHRTCDSHKCKKAAGDDIWLMICPICSTEIKITDADDPNVIFDQHTISGCQPKEVKAPTKERCDADGCYAVLSPINTYSCVKCGGLKYCMKHRFSDAHDCAPYKATKLKSRLVNKDYKGPKERCPLCLMFFPTHLLLEHCNKVHNVT